MADRSGYGDRIVFRLTEDELWVGNSGRALDEADVAGLCGIGASSKSQHSGPRRASIGHKGMGFKSVLEITSTPEAYSTVFNLRMDAALARDPIARLMADLGRPSPGRVPAMRFPWPVSRIPVLWTELQATGINTLFRFPLRDDLSADQRDTLADWLLSLPVTAILFLKHLETVEVEVDTRSRKGRRLLTLERRLAMGDRQPAVGLSSTGTYHVTVREDDRERWPFLLSHDADVAIGGLEIVQLFSEGAQNLELDPILGSCRRALHEPV